MVMIKYQLRRGRQAQPDIFSHLAIQLSGAPAGAAQRHNGVAAKVSQYSYLPQGEVEAKDRVINMVEQMDKEGFGNCTNTGACEVECPKGISLEYIARMNREYLKASLIKDKK